MIEKDSVTICIPKAATEPMVARIKALSAAIQNLNPLWKDVEFNFKAGNTANVEMHYTREMPYGEDVTLMRSLQELCYPEQNLRPFKGWAQSLLGFKRVDVWWSKP